MFAGKPELFGKLRVRNIDPPEPGIRLPALKFTPSRAAAGEPVLYVHGDGKQEDASPGGPIEKLVLSGRTVLAVDVRGIGETAPAPGRNAYQKLIGGNSADVSLAGLLAKSFVAMRAEDILVCARYLAGTSAGLNAPARVAVVANGETGVAALHAAALEPQLLASLRLERSLTSWSEVVRTPLAKNQNVNSVFGALRAYDLPDLVASRPGTAVTLVEPLDPEGNRASAR